MQDSKKHEVGGGSPKAEVRSRRPEVGSRNSEIATHFNSDIRPLTSDL